MLLTLPFFGLGHSNDLVMRVSIPALFALWVFAARALFDRARSPLVRVALAGLLLIGSATPLTEISRSLVGWRLAPPALASTPDLPVAHANTELARQYAGPIDALFFRWLARTADQRLSSTPVRR